MAKRKGDGGEEAREARVLRAMLLASLVAVAMCAWHFARLGQGWRLSATLLGAAVIAWGTWSAHRAAVPAPSRRKRRKGARSPASGGVRAGKRVAPDRAAQAPKPTSRPAPKTAPVPPESLPAKRPRKARDS